MTPPLAFHLLPGSIISDWCSWSVQYRWETYGHPAWVKVCSADLIQWCRDYGTSYASGKPIPITRVYYRPCFLPGDTGEGDCSDGAAWAQKVIAEIRRQGRIATDSNCWPDAIGYRNELNPTAANATEYRRYRAALRAAGYAGLVVYGSFANGRPDWPEYATIPADADALEVHEYFGMSVAGSPDLALRHVEAIRRGLIPATLPIFIGECGADDCGDGTGTRGWQQKMDAGQIAAQLAIYRAGCAPSVVAAFVFTDGDNGDPQWDSYKTRGSAVEAAIRATWGSAAKAPIQTIEIPASATKGATVASLPIPLDNQLTSDGPNKYNECGPASIRMVCDYLGVDPGESIDAIDADETGDPSLIGYTTTNQMVQWFTDRGISAVQSQPQSAAAAIRANLARGWPCVYLGVWDRQAMTGGHFEVPVSDDGASITLNNPWGGVAETLSYADIDRYSLGWLVTVQQTKEVPTVPDDPLTAAAKARFSALGVQPNPDGALFKAYKRMVAVWLANGQDAVLDPTPAIKPEAVTPDGEHAYLLLDANRVLHWRKDTGLVYQSEANERATINKACGWS